MRLLFAALAVTTLGAPAAGANEFSTIRDRGEFQSLVQGRELRMGLFGVSLEVRPDGSIEGSAQGWPITGSWSWQDGAFCRRMDWGGTEIPYNCQLVEARGASQMRFTEDRGQGRAATFSLR